MVFCLLVMQVVPISLLSKSKWRVLLSSFGLRGKSPVPDRRATGWPFQEYIQAQGQPFESLMCWRIFVDQHIRIRYYHIARLCPSFWISWCHQLLFAPGSLVFHPIWFNPQKLRFSQATFVCSMAVHSTASRRAPDARGQRRPRRGRDAGCGWCSGCGHRSIRRLATGRWEETKAGGIWWDIVVHAVQLQRFFITVLNDGHDSPKSTWTGLFFGAAPNNLILSAADGGRCMGKWLDKDPAQPTCMFLP